MSNPVANTKRANEVANTQANEVENANEAKTYTRVIIGADYDAKLNTVWLRVNEPFNRGAENTDSIGKSCKKLCESGAHPLFVLVCKKGVKPLTSVCLFIGAEIKFDVIFAKSGETVDGYKLENDCWCITNLRIKANTPDSFFIEAAKAELAFTPTL